MAPPKMSKSFVWLFGCSLLFSHTPNFRYLIKNPWHYCQWAMSLYYLDRSKFLIICVLQNICLKHAKKNTHQRVTNIKLEQRRLFNRGPIHNCVLHCIYIRRGLLITIDTESAELTSRCSELANLCIYIYTIDSIRQNTCSKCR